MKDILKYPFYLFGVAGKTKSFLENPVIGSKRLNTKGLHRGRVKLAARMADSRRQRLGRLLTSSVRSQLDSDGFIFKENFLPGPVFDSLVEEIYSRPLAAHEMRQGLAVNRMTALGPEVLKNMPVTGSFIKDIQVREMLHYAASYGGEPVFSIQTIISDSDINKTDPQTELHSDTFHPTSKAWLFLHDVGPEDGPFTYAPGSHQLTAKRLEWEYEQSLTASSDPRVHHSLGSFRISESELLELGYKPRMFTVRANTLVVADTRGFHGRTPSTRPTTRVAIYAYLRRNPFIPWTGFDISSLPFAKYRMLDAYLKYLAIRERKVGKKSIWRDVGEIRVDAPANI